MVGPPQTEENENDRPSISSSSSSSSSSASTIHKSVIETLCTHIAETALADDMEMEIECNNNIHVQPQPTVTNDSLAFPPPPPPLPLSPATPPPPPMPAAWADMALQDRIIEDDCKTPKGAEYRIPELGTCPPAPKRSRCRMLLEEGNTDKEFFDPPDDDVAEVLKRAAQSPS